MNAKSLILDSLGIPTNTSDPSNTLKFNPYILNYNGLSGSIGAAYQLDKSSTFKFNISRGFRAPSIAELSSNGKHEGTFKYEIGNQNLKSEISHQLDFAYFFNSDHVTLELTPFVNHISNYIYTEKLKDEMGNDSIPDPTDPVPAFQFVQDNATLIGGEIFLDMHPHPLDWLHIGNSFSIVQATQNKLTDSTKYLPFIPAPKYRGELKAEFKKVGNIFSNCYIKLDIDHYFAQNQVFSAYGTETATPSYTLLSAGMGANIKAWGKKDLMSIYFSAENIADIVYQSHLSRLKNAPENIVNGRKGIYNMGRNISIKLLLNL